MFGNKSLFGYQNDDPVFRRAYDMMVLDQIEKDEKELELQRLYGDPAQYDLEDLDPFDLED